MTTYAWPFYPHKTYTDNIDLTSRPYTAILARTTAFEIGPVAISDAGEGLDAYVWRGRMLEGVFYLSRENATSDGWNTEIELFTVSLTADDTLTEVSFSFDQNGRPVVAYNKNGTIYVYFYDSVIPDYNTIELCAGRNPLVYLDDRENHNISYSDVLIFVVQESLDRMVYFRQRDRYETAFDMGVSDVEFKYLETVAMGNDRRLYIYYTGYPNLNSACECKGEDPHLYIIRSHPYPVEMRDMDAWEHTDDAILSGSLRNSIYAYTLYDADHWEHTDDVVSSGSLRDIIHLYTQYDADHWEHTDDAISSGILRDIIHLYTLYDNDWWEHTDDLISSGSMRQSTLTTDFYDDDWWEHTGDQITGATLAYA